MNRIKIIFLFILTAINLSSCFMKKPNGGYVLFLNPRIKCGYCSNKEGVLKISEHLLKKVFHKKNIENYLVTVGERGDTLILTYLHKESFDHIIQIQLDTTNKTAIDKIIRDKIDTNQMSYYFVFPDIEKYNSDTVTVAIIENYVKSSPNGTITLRHDNICKIIISKKTCRIIDFICG